TLIDNGGNVMTNWTVGDPEWIGVLQDPFRPHSPENRFLGRYAYLIVPISRTLDLNFVHNHAKNVAPAFSGYHRNQGFGSWEINLAAFLADLNTNSWAVPGVDVGYEYSPASGWSMAAAATPNPAQANNGRAFFDAESLFRFRFTSNGVFLIPSAASVFGNVGAAMLAADGIDSFGDSEILPYYRGDLRDDDNDIFRPWAGAHNHRHQYSLHDLFDPAKVGLIGRFSENLTNATYARSTYDQSTFYRLLSQLGTDSEPEPEGTPDAPINLNYVNQANPFVTAEAVRGALLWPDGSTVPSNARLAATNFVNWSPRALFMTIADRLLRQEFTFGVTNIPILTEVNVPGLGNLRTTRILPVAGHTNLGHRFDLIGPGKPLYSPRVHQLLQIAANICDATMGPKATEGFPYYPSVFRPLFRFENNNIYISDFVEVGPEAQSLVENGPWRWFELETLTNSPALYTAAANAAENNEANFYGIPFIIGARKGYPNFNQFALKTTAVMTRRLQFEKRHRDVSRPPDRTNQMVQLTITNTIALEAWNSYTGAYPRPLRLTAYCDTRAALLANGSQASLPQNNFLTVVYSNITAGTQAERWQGLTFKLPVFTNQLILSNSTLQGSTFIRGPSYEALSPTVTNDWVLLVTNQFRYFLFDNGRIVDCVAFGGLTNIIPLSQLARSSPDRCWDITPSVTALSMGISNQIRWSTNRPTGASWWVETVTDPVGGRPVATGVAGFARYLNPVGTNVSPDLVVHAPYVPSFLAYVQSSWEVNDPLVHYTMEDLRPLANLESGGNVPLLASPPNFVTGLGLGEVNQQFNPWGGRQGALDNQSVLLKDSFPLALDYAERQRLAGQGLEGKASDYWDFPTNKFPNVGWLGRVHRGTPWQTIYLKAIPPNAPAWVGGGAPGKTLDTHPTRDWRLVDHFTVAPHPNATRGRLSINQTNLAAWSAVLSGVTVTYGTNNPNLFPSGTNGAMILQPAAYETNIAWIVNAINAARTNLPPPHQFARLGDILAVPALTTRAPHLYSGDPQMEADAGTANTPLSDADYEALPQRILSLLKVGGDLRSPPRFVVYAWGQSLKPAPNSIVQSGPRFGLCRNYQITGETAYRAVVRVEPQLKRDATGNPTREIDWTVAPRAVVESFNILPPE
ncbi:MAG TPA: hypothetical protein VNO52_03765, partial [Methylomirabilota bacterium]|nr:hypothetical protein [Methylomirabilota bacterium]